MHQDQPLVIKIGGSLIEHAPNIINIIRDAHREVLIIPGGGLFADVVRQRDVSDTAAHFMAIAAMDQYGWLLSTYGIPITTEPVLHKSPRILLPYSYLLTEDPLPHSWDITSDTISAYFARLLSAPLILLKSLEYIRTEEGPVTTLMPWMTSMDIDPAFVPYIFQHDIQGQVILGSDSARLESLLRGEEVPGTWFGGTI